MPIEMTSEQMGLERKNTIDNARLFVGIIIGYSFFHTPVCFYSSSRLVTLPLWTYLGSCSLTDISVKITVSLVCLPSVLSLKKKDGNILKLTLNNLPGNRGRLFGVFFFISASFLNFGILVAARRYLCKYKYNKIVHAILIPMYR